MNKLTLDFLSKIEKILYRRRLFKNYKKLSIVKVDLLSESSSNSPIVQALKKRKCYRKILQSKKEISRDNLIFILTSSLKQKSKTNNMSHFPTPTAGGVRELRYFLIVRKVRGIESGLWEYSPEDHQLKLIEYQNANLKEIFEEKWEENACLNIITCIPLNNQSRTYVNNLLHCSFESGAIFQSIQLLLTEINLKSCISGHLNKSKFDKLLGTNYLYPLYCLSIFN